MSFVCVWFNASCIWLPSTYGIPHSSLEHLQHTSRFGLSSANSLKITRLLPASGRVLSIQSDFSQLASDNYIFIRENKNKNTLSFFLSADIIPLWCCKFGRSAWRILSKMGFSEYIKKTNWLQFFPFNLSRSEECKHLQEELIRILRILLSFDFQRPCFMSNKPVKRAEERKWHPLFSRRSTV